MPTELTKRQKEMWGKAVFSTKRKSELFPEEEPGSTPSLRKIRSLEKKLGFRLKLPAGSRRNIENERLWARKILERMKAGTLAESKKDENR